MHPDLLADFFASLCAGLRGVQIVVGHLVVKLTANPHLLQATILLVDELLIFNNKLFLVVGRE